MSFTDIAEGQSQKIKVFGFLLQIIFDRLPSQFIFGQLSKKYIRQVQMASLLEADRAIVILEADQYHLHGRYQAACWRYPSSIHRVYHCLIVVPATCRNEMNVQASSNLATRTVDDCHVS